MLLPSIQYDPGGGPVTLNFTYPPVKKPGADPLHAERTDTFSSSGLRQTICERRETFRTLQMDYVPIVDLEAWSAFMEYAIEGGVFTYFPDANNTEDSEDWSLVDTDWDPTRVSRSLSKFTMKLRKEITE